MSSTYTLLHLTDEQEVEISIKRKAEEVEPVIISKMKAELTDNPQQSPFANTETYSVHEDIQEELPKSKEAEEIHFDDAVSDYPLPLVNNLSDTDVEAIVDGKEAAAATDCRSDQAGSIILTPEPGTDGTTELRCVVV